MTQEALSLAADFAPATREDWLKAVEPILKGAPFEKKLLHKTPEGLTLKPIYVRQDWPAEVDPGGFPGFMPFTRGADAQGRPNGWDVRQEQAHPDIATANQQIRADLARGTKSILIRFDDAARSGRDADQAGAEGAGLNGVMVYSADDMDRLLDGVDLGRVPVALEAAPYAMAAAGLLAAVWKRRGLADAEVCGAFNADPVGAWAAGGHLPVPISTALADASDLAIHTHRTWPNVTAIGVRTAPYHGAGADEAFDLACALATGVTYLRAMGFAGLSIDDACRQLRFCLPVGCDLFMGIAKLRAARRLWARVTEACGASEAARAMRLDAVSADFMMSKRDPWVNMLRTTVAGFAAAVGGADSITLRSYDTALGLPDAMGRRIARNTQIALEEESSLNRVIDPAGGSWFVENLTDELAQAAWSRFQEIEAAGGMTKALESGFVRARIEGTWAARLKGIATRRTPITGVSEFPNIQETLPQNPAPDLAALRDEAKARLADTRAKAGEQAKLDDLTDSSSEWGPGWIAARIVEAAEAGATIGAMAVAFKGVSDRMDPMPRRRLAEPFERLRDASDGFLAKTGARPRIFLANLGTIAQHTARATFAKNFFEVGGIEAISGDGATDPAACAEAFKRSEAEIAILCSADPVYEAAAVDTAQVLKQAGCSFLFLAGSPGEKKKAYLEAGIDDFIFLGCNVLEVLTATLVRLGAIEQ